MKNIILIIVAAIFLQACSSSSQLVRKGRYDEAINKSVKKIQKKPTKEKEIKNLEQAFRIANQKNTDRINFLRASGQPDIWDEVFKIYFHMKNRQERIRILPTDVLSAIDFKYINYDDEIINAQKRAAEYFYSYAMSLLDKGDRFSAREAYDNLVKVKSYYNTYRDVDAQLNKAYSMGQTYVSFEMTNASGIPLPEFFESDFLKISLNDLNSNWVNFESIPVKDRAYHYSIKLRIKAIEVSPEMVKEENWEETKEINDGFQYVMDANGNVMKDTAGNDIKIPKTKIIKAFVKATHLKKNSMVTGVMDIYDNSTGQLMITDPITAESAFEHSVYSAIGDMNALKKETEKKLGGKPVPFPNSADMVMRTVDVLKNVTKSILNRNRRMFR